MTSSGLFFDTHPGWEERAERIKTIIARANDPESTSTQVAYTNEASSSNISAIAQNSMSRNQTQQSYSSKPFSFKSFFNLDKASDFEQKGLEAFMQQNYSLALSMGLKPDKLSTTGPVPGAGGVDPAIFDGVLLPSQKERLILWPKAYNCIQSDGFAVIEGLRLALPYIGIIQSNYGMSLLLIGQ
jgi:hypothetical protein